MKAYSVTNQLKYKFLAFTILGVVLTAVLTGLSVAIPYYSYIKQDNERQLIQSTTDRSRLVETYLNNLLSISSQVTSRTFARKQLELYNLGEIDYQQVNRQTKAVLMDAMNKSPELISIIRYDITSKPIVHIGLEFDTSNLITPDKTSFLTQVGGPLTLAGTYCIYVTAPILSGDKNIVGHDILVYKLDKLKAIIDTPSGLGSSSKISLAYFDNEVAHLFFNTDKHQSSFGPELNSALKQALNGNTGILEDRTENNIKVAYSSIGNFSWALLLSINSDELYNPVIDQITYTSGIMLLLISIGSIVTLIIIKPLSGKILIHTDELENEVKSKTSELTIVNKSLNTLNLANEILLRSDSEQNLLDDITRILVDTTEFNSVLVMLIDINEPDKLDIASFYSNNSDSIDTDMLIQGKTWKTSPIGKILSDLEPHIYKKTHSDIHSENLFRHINNEEIMTAATFPLIDDKNIIGATLAYSYEDITLDKQQINLLQRLNNNLAFGLISIRNKISHNGLQKQLMHAQKMEAIAHLSNVISHEFNNILGYILRNTKFIQAYYKKPNNESDIDEYLKRIKSSISNAKKLLTQLLAFSSESDSSSDSIKIESVINDTQKILNSSMPDTIDIFYHINNHDSQASISPLQLNQIIMNLCMNSRYAMKDIGQIDIELNQVEINHMECTSCHQTIQGNFNELVIKDNGPGISDDLIEHIFEPFYSTKRFGKGSGMGLSMVHGIVHDNNGHIFVTTTLGESASFHILLPVIETNNHSLPSNDLSNSDQV